VLTWVAMSRAVDLGSFKRAEEDSRTWRSESLYSASADGGRFSRVMLPAPPWIMMRGMMRHVGDAMTIELKWF